MRRTLSILSPLVFLVPIVAGLASPARADAEGGIPLGRGTIWTGEGLGATSYGGLSYASRDASPMTRMEGTAWYHYESWLVGGASFHLAMAVPRDEARLFTSRYEIFTSAVWPLGDRSAFQAMWLVGGGKRDFYADTAEGAPPALRVSSSLGSGMLGSIGSRVTDVVAVRLTAGGRWAWLLSAVGANDLEWTWEAEPAVSMGLHTLWPRADALTKAWELALKLPIEYSPDQVDLSGVKGRRYLPGKWQVGTRLGIAVVF